MKMAPKDVRRYSEVLALQRTICYARNSMLHFGHDGSLYIWDRKVPRNPAVKITRSDFEHFRKFLERGQVVKPIRGTTEGK